MLTTQIPAGGPDFLSFFLEGGDGAYGAVYRLARGVARKAVPRLEDAEEVAQDVCFKLYTMAAQEPERIEAIRTAPAFIKVMAVRMAHDQREKVAPLLRAMDAGQATGEGEEALLDRVAETQRADPMESASRSAAVAEAIARLGERDQLAIEVHLGLQVGLVKDMSEAAALLGVSDRKRASERINRAMKKLKDDERLAQGWGHEWGRDDD